MNVAQALYDQAFNRARTARSEAYKAGVLAALAKESLASRESVSVHVALRIECQFRAGTAEYDAFFAGVGEGLAIWRRSQAPRTA